MTQQEDNEMFGWFTVKERKQVLTNAIWPLVAKLATFDDEMGRRLRDQRIALDFYVALSANMI